MTFLPIAERELRVATRRHFTYWSRIVTAAFALVIFGGIYTLHLASRGVFSVGEIQFAVLKWMTFVFACCAGIFLTSDSISEEKREGTIGLLFLTDLKGYDVALGKLLSQSLRAFYGLLAAFPILALPLMMGGVTGGEFGRSVLVLTNTLFLSLTAGLFISTISRDSTKAMNGTLLLTLLLTVGLLLADTVLFINWSTGGFTPFLSVASPAWLLAQSGAYPIKEYWWYVGLQHAMAWGLLIASSFLAARTWHEKPSKQTAKASWSQRWRYGSLKARLVLRRKFLEKNPILWLGLRDRWLPRMALLFTVCLMVGRTWQFIAQTLLDDSAFSVGRMIATQIIGTAEMFLVWGLKLWLAASASRMFVDAIKNGAMELFLVTPLQPATIVKGHWGALWRTFRVPVFCLLLLQVMSGVEGIINTFRYNTSASYFGGEVLMAMVRTGFSLVAIVADVSAIAWFGMWMGLTNRTNAIAILKTVCLVSVLPWIAIWFIIGLIFSLGLAAIRTSGGGLPTWLISQLPMIIFATLTLGKALFFILWSRKRLLTRFREAVLRERRPLFRRRPVGLPPVLEAAAH